MVGLARSFAVAALALLAFASVASGAARLYAPDYGSSPESVHAFEVAANGSLSPVAGSPFPSTATPPTVGGLIGIAFTPDGAGAVAGYLFNGGVQGLAASAAGALAPAGSALIGASTTGIAVTPDGRFAYGPTRDFGGVKAEGVRGYAVGPGGTLTPAGSVGTAESYEIAIGGGGRFLFTIGSTGIERFAIAPTGALSPLGATPVANARHLATSPDGRFLFVSLEGGIGGLVSLTIGADGSLTPNGEPLTIPGGGSELVGAHPNGTRVYLPDESTDKLITVAVAADGKLSAISELEFGRPEAAAVSPDGRFLYVAHGGEDGIATFALDANGIPSPLPFDVAYESGEPVPLVFQPNPAPVASFVAKAAAPGAATTFNAAKSTNAGRFDWDFGDGTTLADGGPKPSHVYAKPGQYTVSLALTDAQGCGAKQVYTGQSTTCPGGNATATTATVDTLPAIAKLKATPKKFLPAGVGSGKGGTKFRVKLNEAAKIGVKIEQRLPGRRVGRKCKKPTSGNASKKKCSRYVRLGSRNKQGKAGWTAIAFNGKLEGKPLDPGGYRITAVATDSAKGRSAPRTAAFRVLPY